MGKFVFLQLNGVEYFFESLFELLLFYYLRKNYNIVKQKFRCVFEFGFLDSKNYLMIYVVLIKVEIVRGRWGEVIIKKRIDFREIVFLVVDRGIDRDQKEG